MHTLLSLSGDFFPLEELDKILANAKVLANLPPIKPESSYKNIKEMEREIEFNERDRTYNVIEAGIVGGEYVKLNNRIYSEKEVEKLVKSSN